MTIPNIPPLNEFLDTLTLIEPADKLGYQSELAVRSEIVSGLSEDRTPMANHTTPEFRLWYKSVGNFNLESLINVVNTRLRHNNHSASRDTAMGIICLYLFFINDKPDKVSFLFELLDNTVRTTVFLFFVFPKITQVQGISSGVIKPITIGDYQVGVIDTSKIRHLCQVVGSDYYKRYKDTLNNRYSITKEVKDTKILNWFKYRDLLPFQVRLVQSRLKMFSNLIENYFTQLHHIFFDDFLRAYSNHSTYSSPPVLVI